MLRGFLTVLDSFFSETFIKFAIVGALNTILTMFIMFVLYEILTLNYWATSMLAVVIASVFSFFMNKYFTFGVKRWSIYMVIKFSVVITISYIFAYGIAKPAVNYLIGTGPQRISEILALFTGMCLFTALNYLGQRFLVFKKPHHK
jgi:putative flippase GtrA